MEEGNLGKPYPNGAVIIREGEPGDRMYIIQSGKVQVTRHVDGKDIVLNELRTGDFFGEMALVERDVRSATVAALGEVYLLSIDKTGFLRRVHEDPSLAYRVIQCMSQRIRELSIEVSQLKARL